MLNVLLCMSACLSDTMFSQVLLYVLGLLPTLIGYTFNHDALDFPSVHWLALKKWPPFMLPPFYLGVVAYDLFCQEAVALSLKQERGRPSWHGYATIAGAPQTALRFKM